MIETLLLHLLFVINAKDVNVNASVNDKLYCEVGIFTAHGCAHRVKLLVETGSSMSILPQSLYEDRFSFTPLLLPKAQLVTYSNQPLSVLGCMTATVTHNAVMGIDLIRSL